MMGTGAAATAAPAPGMPTDLARVAGASQALAPMSLGSELVHVEENAHVAVPHVGYVCFMVASACCVAACLHVQWPGPWWGGRLQMAVVAASAARRWHPDREVGWLATRAGRRRVRGRTGAAGTRDEYFCFALAHLRRREQCGSHGRGWTTGDLGGAPDRVHAPGAAAYVGSGKGNPSA